MNEEHWRRYAQLLIQCGVGLRPGQPLYVYGEVAHRRLMALLIEVAYEAGGGRVRAGRVVDFDAGSGAGALARWLEADAGARYLGEFALAAEDSAIARSGQLFNNTILDENASAHAALGQAYLNAIAGSDAMDAPELEGLGVNHSTIHTDVMFGSASVSIVASTRRQGEVVLMDRGRWAERFLTGTAGRADHGTT